MSGRGHYDRLVFPKGEQRRFLLAVCKKLGASNWMELSRKTLIHRRRLNHWAREEFRISSEEARRISALSGVPISRRVKKLEWHEHLSRAGKLGNKVILQKYGGSVRSLVDEDYRQKKWREWWEREGQFQPHSIINKPKPFRRPRRSAKLAEFVGIVLGDGGITHRQVAITLHRIDDGRFIDYVRGLIEELFDVSPGRHIDKHSMADSIVISRTRLVDYLVGSVGLKRGNKVLQQVDVPDWIKGRDGYLQRCVRGLVDTDGSVFTHRYRVNGKEYSYKKLSFSSRSGPLRKTVYDCLDKLGFRPRFAGGHEVRLDSKESMRRYFQVIGSSNPKHLKRYSQ